MTDLPDTETANAMSETILVAAQKAADSPVVAENDGMTRSIGSALAQCYEDRCRWPQTCRMMARCLYSDLEE